MGWSNVNNPGRVLSIDYSTALSFSLKYLLYPLKLLNLERNRWIPSQGWGTHSWCL